MHCDLDKIFNSQCEELFNTHVNSVTLSLFIAKMLLITKTTNYIDIYMLQTKDGKILLAFHTSRAIAPNASPPPSPQPDLTQTRLETLAPIIALLVYPPLPILPEELSQIHFLFEGYTLSNTGCSFISGTQPAIHTVLLPQKK